MIEDFYWQGISRMRYIVPVTVVITTFLTIVTALGADDLSFELSLKEHKFTPSELTIPADKRVKLWGEVSLYIGPLKGGTYGFFDDFHEDETKGTLIAK